MSKTPINTNENDILKHDNSFNVQFVKTGDRPQNFIKNVDPSCRYVKYPRTAQLMQEKNAWVKKRSHPPVYIEADLQSFDLKSLGGKFDIIYCDPPWQEYEKRAKRLNLWNTKQKQKYYKSWSLDALKRLPVGEIADSPSFIFLWAGCEHLQDARQLLKEWGFKRCEDITWVKTNLLRKKVPLQSEEGIFVRVKQHCLMGYKGDSKRAFDHTFIHPNIDIDVIITEQPQAGSLAKPIEMYDIIERFCLGRRKIELFGCTSNIRSGWLTVGSQLLETKFDLKEYNSWFQGQMESEGWKGGRLMGTTIGIEGLRPKQETGSMRSMDEEGKRSLAKSDSSKF